MIHQLFDALDLDADGQLCRAELGRAARRLDWHWNEAPLYAVLDRLTLNGPLSREAFAAAVEQLLDDPRGPYGDVLRRAPPPALRAVEALGGDEPCSTPPEDEQELLVALRELAGGVAAEDYQACLARLQPAELELSANAASLLVIDPQRSFTRGVWMRSVGCTGKAEREVEPLRLAFGRVARLLRVLGGRVETMLTRCPFPPDSYEWDEPIAAVVGDDHPYFIKPGNSVLWPHSNGFGEWVEQLLDAGRTTLVMGGCTLNSCVRVSSVHTQRRFGPQGLRVAVDLSLAGARTGNFVRSPQFAARSSVESAIRQMREAGVDVVRRVAWDRGGCSS